MSDPGYPLQTRALSCRSIPSGICPISMGLPRDLTPGCAPGPALPIPLGSSGTPPAPSTFLREQQHWQGWGMEEQQEAAPGQSCYLVWVGHGVLLPQIQG